MDKTPLEIAKEWYDEDGIYQSIQNSDGGGLGAWDAIPEDVYSREFSDWLTNQYRLAMMKGIQFGRNGY